MSDEPNWEGLPGGTEHRTVGPVRAWCYQDSCWCYSNDLCWCCGQTRLPEYLRGLSVGDAIAVERERIAAAIETIPLETITTGLIYRSVAARIARDGGRDAEGAS